jgi:hypothetical protein
METAWLVKYLWSLMESTLEQIKFDGIDPWTNQVRERLILREPLRSCSIRDVNQRIVCRVSIQEGAKLEPMIRKPSRSGSSKASKVANGSSDSKIGKARLL